MQNDKHPPPLDPNTKQGESQPVRNDQQEEQERERLWKHESEVPDASTESTGNKDRDQRTDSN